MRHQAIASLRLRAQRGSAGLPDMRRQEIRTNKSARADHERDSEIYQRTRVVGAFPGAQPYLNLAAARLRYRTGTAWSAKCYMKIRPPLSAAGHANRSRRFTALPRHLADTIVCCGRLTHRQLRIVRPSSDRRTRVLFAISVCCGNADIERCGRLWKYFS
jgi:hypothetical protein